jgi:hypothetical protein
VSPVVISPIRHLTVEAHDILRQCRTVFTADHGFGILSYLRTLVPRVVDLLPEYKEGRHLKLPPGRMP